ncbi:MAG: hypothetical protein ACFBSC_02245 [Microcoleaceae cyanobacterium]
METINLKFLLILLGKPGYKSSITDVQPNSKTSASDRNKACRGLGSEGYVEYTEKIEQFRITPAGKSLLEEDIDNSFDDPVEAMNQQKVLKACKKTGSATPSKTNIDTADRQPLLSKMVGQGLIEESKKKIEQVWLTEQGQAYLAKEFLFDKEVGDPKLTKKQINNYLNFLRTYFSSQRIEVGEAEVAQKDSPKPNDEEILQAITALDQELGTDNYLPIFYLREKLQPPLSRDELDQALYRLQRQDKIELSLLVEAIHYTSEQFNAGIPQEAGGRLFYIAVETDSF